MQDLCSSLNLYLEEGFKKVDGWCNPNILYLLDYISSIQKQEELKGGVVEIGVHHGKLFLGLHQLTEPDEVSLAIDVFDNQELNIDNSGRGNLQIFQNHVKHYSVYPESIRILTRDSTTLSSKDIVDIESEFGKFRLFSIDGGHTPEHTISDFNVAEQLLCNGGVMILDDYLNPHWPGVHEGIAYLFLHNRPRLSPFLLGAGKLLFTTVAFHEKYLSLSWDWLKTKRPQDACKRVRLYGYDLISWGF